MTSAVTMLNLDGNRLCISGLAAPKLINHFPGIARIKPVTFFGEPYPLLCERLGLTKDQLTAWYERIHSAYRHFWGDPTGRLHCYQPRPALGSQGVGAAIAKSVVPAMPGRLLTKDKIKIGLEVPSVELCRRACARPKPTGRLQVGARVPKKEHPQFIQVELEVLSTPVVQQLGANKRVDEEGLVWLSVLEADAVGVPVSNALKVAWVAGSEEPQLSRRAKVDPWEALSPSVAAAHFARLAGDTGAVAQRPTLNGLINAGAARACLAERIRPILDALPEDTVVDHSLGRIQFEVDSGSVDAILRLAYDQALLPLYPVRGFSISWHRSRTPFDILFEMTLTGQTNALVDIDVQSLAKGGVSKWD